MRVASMCFSMFQVPRCRIYNFTCLWGQSLRSSNKTSSTTTCLRVLCSQANGLEEEYGKRWVRRTASTKTDGSDRSTRKSKSTAIQHEILDETVSSTVISNLRKTVAGEVQTIHYLDIRQRIAEIEDLSKFVTVITFDIETTGFSRENDRIIEIALQDLQGGENSTFQTLVNPECYVSNSHVHGIATHMVQKPGVPRMEELAPILVQYISSRQRPGGYVMLVAHNARSFDVPFLVRELSRCSVNIPSNWLFLDTLPLARQFLKTEGGSKLNSKASLPALVEVFNIPSCGTAHRAMSDVRSLSMVFQQLTEHLKLSLSSLVRASFTASDLAAAKKKNSR